MDAILEITSRATKQSDQLHQELPQQMISLGEKLKEAKEYATRRPWEKWCIYRVPRRLKVVQKDKKAYEPLTTSIGPYHRGSEEVREMDLHKWVALHQILERTGQEINLYFDSIKKVEEQARACYQQDVAHLSSNEFVEVMVLDGCFILELFRSYPRAGGTGNPVFSNQRIMDDILLDMIILENQLPFFIIDRLHGLMSLAGDINGNQYVQAMDLALNLINPEWLTGKPLSPGEFDELRYSIKQEECLHVLDVFRRSLLYAWPQEDTIHRDGFRRRECDKLVPKFFKQLLQGNKAPRKILRHGQVIQRVTELKEGGVKFRKRDTNCFWDIRFKNGVLEIPSVWIQDKTKTILQNVAAFENCHLKLKDSVIASYVVFMECLIKSPEDVSYLHCRGIIQHLLGSDAEVVDMFKSVSREMIVDATDGYYAEISEQVNAYCNRRRNRWRANLLQNYFNSPWAIISLAVAFILLSLTAIQSFYAVYAYYKPPKS